MSTSALTLSAQEGPQVQGATCVFLPLCGLTARRTAHMLQATPLETVQTWEHHE